MANFQKLRALLLNVTPPTNYLIWWSATLLTFLSFDILWCTATSFRPFTYSSLYLFLLLAATVFSLPAALTRKSWPQVTLMVLLDILLIANLMYSRTYFVAIPLECYGMASNLRDFTESVTDSFRTTDLILPAITLAAWFINRKFVNRKSTPALWAYAAGLILLSSAAAGSFMARGGFSERMKALSAEFAHLHVIAPVYTVFCSMAYDAMTSTADITPAEMDGIRQWLSDHDSIAASLPAPQFAGPRPQNLILILCESLESWPIGLTLEGKPVTPVLNTLISDSTTYYAPYVKTQVGAGRSIDGQLLMMAGMMPINNGVYSMKYSASRYHTIPRAMKKRGAKTIMLTLDEHTAWNQGAVTHAFGIDTLICSPDWDRTATGAVSPLDGHLTDKALFTQSRDKLSDGTLWRDGERVFIAMVTRSGHNPFKIAAEADSFRLDRTAYPTILADYLTAANYTDRCIGLFIDYLKSRPDWDKTTVIITGDHEGLAQYRKGLTADGRFPYVESDQFCPLIILNAPIGGKNTKIISQADTYSAMLDLMGLDSYPWRGMGLSPFSTAHPGFAVGSRRDISGEVTPADSAIVRHLTDAYDVSDKIIRHNLFDAQEFHR